LSSIPLLKAGRLRSPVFFQPHRAPNFPDVPTTGEATGHSWHNGVWRGFDMIYLDSAGVVAFMKADDEDNGKAPKSLGLVKQAAVARMSGAISGAVPSCPGCRSAHPGYLLRVTHRLVAGERRITLR